MARVFKTVTFMVLAFTAAVVFAEREDYDVGDDTKWTRPTDLEFYSTWAAGKTFHVGDELEFEFAAGRHDVAVVTQEAFENCETTKPISLMTVSPVKINLNTSGPHYFICTVGDHCRMGQKLSVDVVGAVGTPGSSTPVAGGTTPPTSGGTTTPSGSTGTTTPSGGATGTTTTTTSPAGNAASSLGGATFLVAFVSAIVVALF